MLERSVRYSAVSNEPRHGLLHPLEQTSIDNVELVPVQMNRMPDLIVHVHQNRFDNRVQLQLDQMRAGAGGEEFVVEAMLSDRAVLVAEHRLIDVVRLCEDRKRRVLQADVVERSDAVEVGSRRLN